MAAGESQRPAKKILHQFVIGRDTNPPAGFGRGLLDEPGSSMKQCSNAGAEFLLCVRQGAVLDQ